MIDVVAIDMRAAINALTRLHEGRIECELPDAGHRAVLALANLSVALDGLERLDRQLGKDDG